VIVNPSPRPALAERLMKLEEVAELFGVEPRTVADWARAGKIRANRTPGGQYRFLPAAVEALLADDPDFAAHNKPEPAL